MAMAGGNHGDAGGEVKKFVAIGVLDAQATPALCD
jgi:hypothetical protein